MPWSRRYLAGLVVSTGILLAACDSRLAGLSDAELQDRMRECNGTSNQSPGFAISCDNYRRECAARRKQGKYVC